jgi:hypothetical protein
MNMETRYAIIWFEGQDKYTLVDRHGSIVTRTEKEITHAPSIVSILRTQSDVEDAQDDLKYAISTELLENLFGCDVD